MNSARPSRIPSIVEIEAFSPGAEKVLFKCQISRGSVGFVWCREAEMSTGISILFILRDQLYCILDKETGTTTECRRLAVIL